MNIATQLKETKYTQLLIWPRTNLAGTSPEEFEALFFEKFAVRVKFAELVELPGGRTDLLFFAADEDFHIWWELLWPLGIKYWEQVIGLQLGKDVNLCLPEDGVIYPAELIERYPWGWGEGYGPNLVDWDNQVQ